MRAANVEVKTSVARVLSSLIQSFKDPNSLLNKFSLPTQAIEKILPLHRLEGVLQRRLERERSGSPIYSQFVQALTELINSLRNALKSSQVNIMISDLWPIFIHLENL